MPVGSREPQSQVGWLLDVFSHARRCVVGARDLFSFEIPRDELFGDVESGFHYQFVFVRQLHRKYDCAVSFPSVFMQTFNHPGFAVEVFRGQIRGGGSVYMRLWIVHWCRCDIDEIGCDSVNTQGSTLDNRGPGGKVENLAWAFADVHQLELLVTRRPVYDIRRVLEDPDTQCRPLVCIEESLIEVGLVTPLRFEERCKGLGNLFMQFFDIVYVVLCLG